MDDNYMRHLNIPSLCIHLQKLVGEYDAKMTTANAEKRIGNTYESNQHVRDAGTQLRYAIDLYVREDKVLRKQKQRSK